MGRFGLKHFLFAFGLFFAASSGAQAQPAGVFGALALAPDGAYGYSYNYRNIDEAQDNALDSCRKHGKGCQIIRVFENVCVTLAGSLDGNNFVANWVSGYNASERPERATRACRNDGGKGCKVLAEFCTGSGR